MNKQNISYQRLLKNNIAWNKMIPPETVARTPQIIYVSENSLISSRNKTVKRIECKAIKINMTLAM